MKKQSSPKSERFGMLFVELARRWRRAIDARLAQAGLTDATWAPLIHLHEFGDGIQQKSLAVRVGLDGSTLVRLLDILAERGLVERREDPQDRRAKRIYITAQGKRAVRDIRKLLSRVEQEMLIDVTADEIEQVCTVMEKIGVRVQHVLDSDQGGV